MKFSRNTKFDSQFDQIQSLVWYPYVGNSFENCDHRLMIFAHNIPINEADYESKVSEWSDKATWADAMEEYTYEQKDYTKAFRAFIKAATGLKSNYGYDSENQVTEKVDAFISRIAFGNFIQGLVKSDKQIATADPEKIAISQRINQRILEILGITHCICWGANVFDYITNMDGFKILKSEDMDIAGFGSCTIQTKEGKMLRIMKVFHPSMPSFSPFSDETQNALSNFMADPVCVSD